MSKAEPQAAPTNGEQTSFEAQYAAKLAKLKAGRKPKEEAAAEARRKRDVDELELVGTALDEIDGTWDDNVLRVPDAPPTMCGHIVIKRPAPSATKQWKSIILAGTKIDADRGASERRVNATKTYLVNCLKYPSLDKLEELLGFAAAIPDSALKIINRLADAGAQDEAKE